MLLNKRCYSRGVRCGRNPTLFTTKRCFGAAISALCYSTLSLVVLAALQSCDAADGGSDTRALRNRADQGEQVSAAVVVRPGDDVQAALDDLSAGQVLRMTPGRYIGLSLELRRPGITIEAEGAEMDGAAFDLAGAALAWSGTAWTASGLPEPLNPFPGGRFKKDARREAPTAELQAREDLYVCEAGRENCVKYRRRPPKAILGRGEYATSSDGKRLLVCPHWGACASTNDWAGRLLLLTTTSKAITCTPEASGVTIRGLTVRRYAPQFHSAQLDGSDCAGMRLEGVSILESHAIGYWAGPASIAVDSHFDDNGQLGVEASNATVRFENSSCNRNNTNGFPNWNAGGCKFFSSPAAPKPGPEDGKNRVTWIGGEIVGNDGNGFWTDGSAFDAVVRGALVAGNSAHGVHLELTFGGLVENNVFRGNGTECSGDKAAGSAILINQTEDAVVRNNLIYITTSCGRGINFRHNQRGFWVSRNNRVVNNTIVQVDPSSYGTNGFWILRDEGAVTGNVIDRNTYVLSTDDNHRRWRRQVWEPRGGSIYTFEQWQQAGYDRNGRVLRVEDPAAYVRPVDE